MQLFERPELRGLLLAERLLVVDLELTCGPGVTADIQDIIEIGLCALTIGTPASFEHAQSIYVRPERSQVSDFCTKLTGITTAMVSHMPSFALQAQRIREAATASGASAWASWGPDHTLLHRQCVAADVDNPLGALTHVDIRRLLTPAIYALTGGARPQGSSSGVGLASALRELGLAPSGRAHSGRDDALSAARVLERVRELAEQHLMRPAAVAQRTHTGRLPTRPKP